MEKIGIVTINDYNNYGNRLQCYAVNKFIEKMGYEVYSIRFIEKSKLGYIVENLKKIIKYLINYDNQKNKNKRYKYFKYFNYNIKFDSRKLFLCKYKKRDLKYFNNEYLTFFVGSDQVWNPFYEAHDTFFLNFVTNDSKKNSISASVGVDKIEDNFKEKFITNLKLFNKISVREDKAKEEIKKLTGRDDIEVLVDPTMLLEYDEWKNIEKKPMQIENIKSHKYILCYFLGNLQDEYRAEIERIAKVNDCEIIDILNITSPFYKTGPSEFLYLERNAFLVCTDSFHSCVFAILFDTPFIVFDRKAQKARSMGSRINTLLSKFNLKNRKFEGKITDDLLKCNYEDAKKILDYERIKAKSFIEAAIKNID